MDNTPLLDFEHLNVEEEKNVLKIVLLGETGSGKSSLANTITGGQAEFKVSHFAGSETKVCQCEIEMVNGKKLRLIDTPGLLDTELNNTEIKPAHLRFLLECAPEIHGFLILLKVERFTKHEKEVTQTIFKQFGKESLKYSTVVFTHGDQLPEGMTIEEWVEKNDGVKNLVQKCGGRCHVFDNKCWNHSEHPYRNNQVHVENLLNTIEETVRINGGRCYTINESSGDDAQSKRNEAKNTVRNRCIIGLFLGGITLAAFIFPFNSFWITRRAGIAILALGIVGGLAGIVFKLKKEKKKL